MKILKNKTYFALQDKVKRYELRMEALAKDLMRIQASRDSLVSEFNSLKKMHENLQAERDRAVNAVVELTQKNEERVLHVEEVVGFTEPDIKPIPVEPKKKSRKQ